MEHRIVHRKPWFSSRGTNLIVHLDFTPEEQKLIKENNMERVAILEREPTTEVVTDRKTGKERKQPKDNNIYFGEFYGRRTSWRVDSQNEAKEVHAQLFLGFQRFAEYLESNKTPATHSEGDFAIKPPPAFSLDLIPTYMWAQHCFVLAESGGGKTQLLQTIVAEQMKKPTPPGFVIIDSQDQILQLIQAKFSQAVMIDPYDNPPSLDLFKSFGTEDLAQSLDTFRYLFEAGAQPLTDRQRTAFEFALALMLIGYPAAHGQTATIDDFEQYLMGEKKGMDMPARAHAAVSAMPLESTRQWYYTQYANFREAHGQILQRLSNICGQFSPLRPLFSKQTDTLNLTDAVDAGRMILVNTKKAKLGPYSSAFFGRFFFKLLERAIGARTDKSHPLLFIVDEVQEYFDATVMTPFLDQARKRNISCVFATQRLSHLHGQELLRDALTGVGTLIATNLNKNDVREMAEKFAVEPEQAHAWLPEWREGEERPRYADFGLKLKGKSAQTFRLKFGQLEAMPSKRREERQERTQQSNHQQEPPKQSNGPHKDTEYDDRYDLLWELNLSPVKAKSGTVLVIKKLPNGRSTTYPIPPGTKDGFRFCLKKESLLKRPDGTIGNLWIELRIAEYSNDGKEEF